MADFPFAEQFWAGQTYEEYLDEMASVAEADDPDQLSKRDRKYHRYIRLNHQRTRRAHGAYTPSDSLLAAIKQIGGTQYWMVLTENWCGDSAQNLPVIVEAAKHSPEITLRILSRDDHPEIMDQYLTNGKRGIPKLVVFGQSGEELFTWGPRPKPAAQLFSEKQDEGLEKKKIYRALQRWYNEDEGQTVDRELRRLLRKHTPAPEVRS